MNLQKYPVLTLLISGAVGWLLFIGGYAIFMFLIPHRGIFAPEMGPLGTFAVFTLAFSVLYCGDFLFIGLPIYFLLRYHRRSLGRVRLSLIGSAMFALSVPVWSCAMSDYNLWDMAFISLLVSPGGFGMFFTLDCLRAGNR